MRSVALKELLTARDHIFRAHQHLAHQYELEHFYYAIDALLDKLDDIVDTFPDPPYMPETDTGDEP